MLALWVWLRILPERFRAALPTLYLVLALVGIQLLARFAVWPDDDGQPRSLAFPWYVPIGSTVAFVWSLLLDRPAPGEPASEDAPSRA